MCKGLVLVGCGTGNIRRENSGMGGEGVDGRDMKHEWKRKKVFVFTLF